MGLTTILWVTVALLTKPDPDELLRRFYQRARPLGCWTPFKNDAEAIDGSEFRPVLRGLFIALMGTSATALLILGLTQMWFGCYGAGALSLVASVILFFVFRKLIKAFLDFLASRTEDQFGRSRGDETLSSSEESQRLLTSSPTINDGDPKQI